MSLTCVRSESCAGMGGVSTSVYLGSFPHWVTSAVCIMNLLCWIANVGMRFLLLNSLLIFVKTKGSDRVFICVDTA